MFYLQCCKTSSLRGYILRSDHAHLAVEPPLGLAWESEVDDSKGAAFPKSKIASGTEQLSSHHSHLLI